MVIAGCSPNRTRSARPARGMEEHRHRRRERIGRSGMPSHARSLARRRQVVIGRRCRATRNGIPCPRGPRTGRAHARGAPSRRATRAQSTWYARRNPSGHRGDVARSKAKGAARGDARSGPRVSGARQRISCCRRLRLALHVAFERVRRSVRPVGRRADLRAIDDTVRVHREALRGARVRRHLDGIGDEGAD